METVQLSLADTDYADRLRDLLSMSGSREVRCVELPDAAEEGVIVVDSNGLNRLPTPLRNPERVVLITNKDPQHLAEAWNAGIRSVVFSGDPLSTAVLAIMAAGLRVPRPETHGAPNLGGAPGGCSACGIRPGCAGAEPAAKERRG